MQRVCLVQTYLRQLVRMSSGRRLRWHEELRQLIVLLQPNNLKSEDQVHPGTAVLQGVQVHHLTAVDVRQGSQFGGHTRG